jgi:hypothetical protein
VNQINQLPESPNAFGDTFDYATWTAGTNVKLCNVPWNSDYRDIVRFPSAGALDQYIDGVDGATVVVNNLTYAAMGRPIRLNIPFNRANRFNYIRVKNPLQPIANDTVKHFYYFITGVAYVAPNTTEIMLQLDVWQTFGHTVKFGNCYVETGHIGIAASKDADTSYAFQSINQPEGLDIGGEYVIEKVWSRELAKARGDGDYRILVMSAVSLDVDAKNTDGSPRLQSATGSSFENLPNGCEYYLFDDLDAFKAFMVAYREFPWLTQGIMSIQAVPNEYNINVAGTGSHNGVSLRKVVQGSIPNKRTKLAPAWRDDVVLGPLGRYRNLRKFLTFPYSVMELTTYAGTPIIIKPDSWGNDDAEVVEMAHFASSGARIMFYPLRYNAGSGSPMVTETLQTSDAGASATNLVNDGGEFLDMATGIVNLPTFSLVNDGFMSYMAANMNGINFQHSSADWSQQRALSGNELASNQASAGIATSQQVNRLGINATNSQLAQSIETMGFKALQSGANGVLNSLGSGNILGAVGSVANAAAGYAIDTNQATASTAISTQLSGNTNRAQTGLQGYVRDTNKDYADFATKGDYANAIAGINAKVQDARLTQPTTSGQVGGDAFNLAKYKWGYDLKLKTLQPAAMRTVGEFWLRYGYRVNQFVQSMPFDLQVMEKFTYWKLRETYLTSSECPETFRQTIRGIFEKGVTVWRDPDDIGFIDIADNEPLEGITL